MQRPQWFWGANWQGGLPPAGATTGTLTFLDQGGADDDSVTNIVDQSYAVGGLTFANIATRHTTDLDAWTLTVQGDVNVGANVLGTSVAMNDGTLQIGIDVQPGALNVGYTPGWDKQVSGTLVLSNVALEPLLSVCNVGVSDMHGRRGEGTLDLTNATIQGGVFKTNELYVGLGSGSNGAIQFNEATGLTDLEVTTGMMIGGNRGRTGRIGDPATDYKLPANVNLTFGNWGATRCNISIGGPTIYYDSVSDGKLVASSGGTCSAYVDLLRVGYHPAGAEPWAPAGYALGILDLSAMDSVTMDANRIEVSAAAPVAEGGHNDGRGYVYLPVGTVVAGEVLVGHPDVNETNSDFTAEAVLELNGTTLTANTSMAVGHCGDVEARVLGTSGGIDLAAGATLTVGEGGNINLVFAQPPSQVGVYWGLRWEGDHVAELDALTVGETPGLTWDDSAVAEEAGIFFSEGYTYVGLAGGVIRVLEFTLSDATSGSTIYTNDATVDVSLVGEAGEGETINGYLVTESTEQPTEGWLPTAPTTYTIQGAPGTDVTVYGWIKDTGGNVGSRPATVYYQPAVPQVSGLIVTEVSSAVANVTWTTDIETFGVIKYKAFGAEDWVIAADADHVTDHSLQMVGLVADIMYTVLVINNEKQESPLYYPATWPIEGDATLDWKVNILDLIYTRNRLNTTCPE